MENGWQGSALHLALLVGATANFATRDFEHNGDADGITQDARLGAARSEIKEMLPS